MTEYAWQDFRLSPDDRVAAMTGPVQVLDHPAAALPRHHGGNS